MASVAAGEMPLQALSRSQSFRATSSLWSTSNSSTNLPTITGGWQHLTRRRPNTVRIAFVMLDVRVATV